MPDPSATGAAVIPYQRDDGSAPQLRWAAYRSTEFRAPARDLTVVPHTLTEVTGPLLGEGRVREADRDLTRQHAGEPLGERIIVHGRLLDAGGRPVQRSLVELWQANSAGRYRHHADDHDAPVDPNFTGVGRCLTDGRGAFRFVTVKPGAYPWRNHANAWRPAHIHLSVFGRAFTQRLVTQMYFPGDPLLDHDPVLHAVRDPRARQRLVSALDLAETVPEWALAYRFDLVLRGRDATPFENVEGGT